jgi:hypothetical protein
MSPRPTCLHGTQRPPQGDVQHGSRPPLFAGWQWAVIPKTSPKCLAYPLLTDTGWSYLASFSASLSISVAQKKQRLFFLPCFFFCRTSPECLVRPVLRPTTVIPGTWPVLVAGPSTQPAGPPFSHCNGTAGVQISNPAQISVGLPRRLRHALFRSRHSSCSLLEASMPASSAASLI